MKNVMLFLRESNAVEDIWDELSLTYARAAWDYLIKQEVLTVKNILKTHAILMHGKLDPKETGAYRRRQVWIGEHEAKSWYVIPELMDQWIKIANHGSKINDFDVSKNDHILFESTHPFIDGNGRIGRILLNWQRIKAGLPILVIKEAEKQEYYNWFLTK